MPRHLFELVGRRLSSYLGQRAVDFRLTMQMFELQCTALTDLNPFLILEELSILIEEIEDNMVKQHLTYIYRAFKHQTYSEGMVVATLIK